jgi:hypothetical protein
LLAEAALTVVVLECVALLVLLHHLAIHRSVECAASHLARLIMLRIQSLGTLIKVVFFFVNEVYVASLS